MVQNNMTQFITLQLQICCIAEFCVMLHCVNPAHHLDLPDAAAAIWLVHIKSFKLNILAQPALLEGEVEICSYMCGSVVLK